MAVLVAIIASSSPITVHASSGGGSPGDFLLGSQVPLTTVSTSVLAGNYVAAGAGMRDSSSGTITVSIPAGATLTKAILIWGMMDFETTTSDIATLDLNGQLVTGTGAVSGDLCWSTDHYTGYWADVTGIAISGANLITAFPTSGFLGEGATLILIYTHAGDPMTDVIVNFGAQDFYGQVAGTPTTFSFASASGVAAKTTGIVADGQHFGPNSMIFNGGTIDADTYHGSDGAIWDTQTRDVTAQVTAGATSATASTGSEGSDCIGWTGQVLSVAVGPQVLGAPEFGAPSVLVAGLGLLAISVVVRLRRDLLSEVR